MLPPLQTTDSNATYTTSAPLTPPTSGSLPSTSTHTNAGATPPAVTPATSTARAGYAADRARGLVFFFRLIRIRSRASANGREDAPRRSRTVPIANGHCTVFLKNRKVGGSTPPLATTSSYYPLAHWPRARDEGAIFRGRHPDGRPDRPA